MMASARLCNTLSVWGSALGLDIRTACRLRLVCTLLGTCGQYFSRGGGRRKLDRYLAYLQRYLLAKPALPLDVEFDVQARAAAVPWPPLQLHWV